jgi:RimJ/RimL family protein N-acetyltransferase
MFENMLGVQEFQHYTEGFSKKTLNHPSHNQPAARPERVSVSGQYVTLQPLMVEHIPLLWPLANEAPARWRWLSFGPFEDYGSFKVYAKLMLASQAEMLWCVRPHHAPRAPGAHDTQGAPGAHDTQGAPGGWIALLDIQNTNAAIELGNVWLSERLARTRAATETMALLLNYAFDHLGNRRVAWKCNALHTASRRCAERLGFSYEGTLRAHMIVRGERRDSAYYSMLAEEWPARRAALGTWLDPRNFDENQQQKTPLERAA